MVDRVNRSTRRRLALAPALAALVLTPVLASSAHAATPVPLGTADSFAVLAGSTITNTGSTTISGDIGLCCTGLATTGFGPGANQVNQPSGAQYVGPGSLAANAQDDLDIAYGDAAGQPVTNTVPVDLSLTGTPANPLLPGVYQSTARGSLQINTGLTLDFQGDPNAVFIFQGTDLATATGAGGSVTIVNGGAAPSACNITWQLSDATQGVTLGTNSAFKGTTLALGASVLGTGATVEGRILTRRSTAVTLDTNTITRTACFAATAGGGGGGGAPASSAPSGTVTASPTPAAAPAPSTWPGPMAAPTPTSGLAPGFARLIGPRNPVRGPFAITVTGRGIAKVIFYVDGRRVGTAHAKRGRTKFKLNIDPRRQSRRVHRVTARVVYRRNRETRTSTLRTTYRRPSAPRSPRFTG